MAQTDYKQQLEDILNSDDETDVSDISENKDTQEQMKKLAEVVENLADTANLQRKTNDLSNELKAEENVTQDYMALSQDRIADSQDDIAFSQGRIADSGERLAKLQKKSVKAQKNIADSQSKIASAQNELASSTAKSASAQVRSADTAQQALREAQNANDQKIAAQKEMAEQAKRSASAQELSTISQFETSQNVGKLANAQEESLSLQAERNQLYEKANRGQISKFDEEEKQKQLYNININKREQQLKDADEKNKGNTPERLCFNYVPEKDNYVSYLNKLLFFKCEIIKDNQVVQENNILTAFNSNFMDTSNYLKLLKQNFQKYSTIAYEDIRDDLDSTFMKEIKQFIISFSSKQNNIMSFVETNFSELQQDKSKVNPSFSKLTNLFEKYCVIYDPAKTYNATNFNDESVSVIEGFARFGEIIEASPAEVDKDLFIYYLDFVESAYNLTYNMYLWFNYLYYLQPLSATATKDKFINDEMLSVYNFIINKLKRYISSAHIASDMTDPMFDEIAKYKVVNIKLPLFDDIDTAIRSEIVYGNDNNTKGKGSRILFLPPEMFLLNNYFSYKNNDPDHKHKIFIKCTPKKLTYNHYINDKISRNVFFNLDTAASNSKYSSFYIKLVVEKGSMLPDMSNMFRYAPKSYPSTFTSSYVSDQNMLQNNESAFHMMFNIEKLYHIDEKTEKKITKSSTQQTANKQNRLLFIEKLKDEDVVMNYDNLQSPPFYEPEKNIFINLKYNINTDDDSVISDIIMLILTNSVFYNSAQRKYNIDLAAIPIFDMVEENNNAYFKNSLYDIYAEQIVKMITNEDEFNKIIPVVKNCIIKNGQINYQQTKQLKQCLKDNKFVNKGLKSFLKTDRIDKAFLTISYFIMYVLYHYLKQTSPTRNRGGKRKKTPKYRLPKNKSIKLKK